MSRRDRLLAAQNYVLYYGQGRAQELARFDLAIVEPLGQNPQTIQDIRDSGTLVCAYLSVVEFNEHLPLFHMLRPGDYLTSAGQPLFNKQYGNYLADLCSPRWRGLLLYQAGQLLLNTGYDGLFLDTIGDVEDPFLAPELRQSQLRAATEVIELIRRTFPEHILIQNNGLEKLCLCTAGMVDAFCWENPPLDRGEGDEWASSIWNRLLDFQENLQTKILLLTQEKAYNAPDNGFLYYCAARDYLSIR